MIAAQIFLMYLMSKSKFSRVLDEVVRSILQTGDYNGILAQGNISTKVALLTFNIFAFLLFACYTSLLTSYMTSPPLKGQIQSFRDIYEQV